MEGNIFSAKEDGASGCTFLPGPVGRETPVCKQAEALKELRRGEWGEIYELKELRQQCCLSAEPTTREHICPAYPSLCERGRGSCWAR